MDSASAKAVANQKVFVTLESVMDVQANFNRLLAQPRSTEDAVSRHYLRGIAFAIRTLNLPMDIPNGF